MTTAFRPSCSIFHMFVCLMMAGCSGKDEMPVNCSVSGPAISVASTTAPTCSTTGTITVAASGGTEPLTFSINGLDFQSSSEFAGLAPGTYTLTVMDANECTATTSVGLTVKNDLTLSFTANVAGCEGSEGSIEFSATGGSGTYLYSIDGENFVESSVFSGLASGEYSVAVKDGFCEFRTEAIVPSGLSFDTAISAIIKNKCAVDGCHVTGSQFPDMTSFKGIQDNAKQIGLRVGNRGMPPMQEGIAQLEEDEIDKIVCWVTDGAPNN
ncbi:MAG: hypothetical protein RIF36_15075 [Imperialibacter sp.]|uniref:hypothetical protein n=1 Tax=Imperialibacter sp. TaxID=2038411 RepID=UPI0032EF24C6